MARAHVMLHKNARIVHIDLSNASFHDIQQAVSDAKPHIQGQPAKSVLCWVKTEGTKISTEISSLLKEFTLQNKPFIKMTAITGVEGVQKVVISAIIMFTKRDNLVVKNNREEALDFLASIGNKAETVGA